MKRAYKILSLVFVFIFLVTSVPSIFVFAGEENDEYNLVIEAYDWGPAVSKIVVSVGEDTSLLTKGDFTSYVRYQKGMWGQPPAEGSRDITRVYPSDAKGKPVDKGTYLTIEMTVHPSGALDSPFEFTIPAFVNVWTAFDYTVVQKSTGKLWDVEGERIKPLADEFNKGNHSFADIDLTYADYSPPVSEEKNPLIVWLHGAGEGGNDPDIALIGNKVVNLITEDIQGYFEGGAYVLTPQTQTMWMNDGSGGYTQDGTSMYTEALMDLIKTYVDSNPDIDKDRIYLGGCSNGGFMTMNMLVNYPKYFAAAYPICEAYEDKWITDEQLKSISNIPIWFTHSKDDTTVNPDTTSVATYNRLKDLGAEVHLSLFDNVIDTSGLYKDGEGNPHKYMGHWSWVYTLNNECFIETAGGKEYSVFEWLSYQTKEADELDISFLEFLIKEADRIVEDGELKDVIEIVVKKFNESVKEGKDLMDRVKIAPSTVTAEEISKAQTKILDAFFLLEMKGNKDKLKRLISKSAAYEKDKEKYIKSTYDTFENALKNARDIIKDDIALQDEMDDAWDDLAFGLARLRLIPNRDRLIEALKKGKAINPALYTANSYLALEDIMGKGDKMLEIPDEDAKQNTIDDSADDIINAINNLVLLPDDTSKTDADVVEKIATTPKKDMDGNVVEKVATAPKTGEVYPIIAICIVVFAAGIVIVLKKRKES